MMPNKETMKELFVPLALSEDLELMHKNKGDMGSLKQTAKAKAPENRPSQKEMNRLPSIHFQGQAVQLH